MVGNMHKLLSLLLFIGIGSLCGEAYALSEFKLNEASLKELALKGSPQLDQIEASFLAASYNNTQTREGYSPELFGKASYGETNERAILTFIPVWSPTKQGQIGLRQELTKGFTAEAAVGTQQQSAVSAGGKYKDITTTSLSFLVQMDLWKDLLGRMSEAKLDSALLDAKRAEIEKHIQTKSFYITLRRVYWSIVATEESIKISEEILSIAKKQAEETKQRFKNSVAEADEVARNNAQVASKQALLIYYQFQKENLYAQLKTLLPELMESTLSLSAYDLPSTVGEVTACTALIAQESKVPYHFTKYDEATEMIRKVKAHNQTINSRYAGADVKLYGKVRATGVGSDAGSDNTFNGSYGSSIDDITSTNRTGYEVGLNFTIPLGSAKEQSQKTKELYDEKRLLASINARDAQVINTHQQLGKNIALLNEVIKAQKTNSKELEKRLRFMNKKYQQARVSINDLIQDQDSLLRAQLNTVETQLQVLNVLFDYLAIYTETPCSFNRI
jgi:outer membrane protein TolC